MENCNAVIRTVAENRENGKQVKTKSVCLHLHVLLCILKLPEQRQESSCSSVSTTALNKTPDATDFCLSVSRTSSIKLKLL